MISSMTPTIAFDDCRTIIVGTPRWEQDCNHADPLSLPLDESGSSS